MPDIATEATFSCVSYASARSAYDSNEGAKQGYFGASRREKRALQTPLPCKDKPRSHAMLRDDVRGNTPKRATRFERATFSLEGCSDVSQDAEFAGTYSGVSETPDSRHDSSPGDPPIDNDLSDLIDAWHTIPSSVRTAIVMMARATTGNAKEG